VGAILLSLLVAALGIGRSVATAVLTWLPHRSFWQLAFGAALIFAGIQTIRVKAEQRHSTKVEAQLGKAAAELNAISSKKNDQAVVTRDRIKIVTQRIHDADGKARAVEQAPLPGNCKTPPEILQADL
jgi:hypothetical protein